MRKKFFVFERIYYIDEFGNVFNQFNKNLNHHYRKYNDYPYVEFRHKTNGIIKRKKIFVHRLLAELFLPNPKQLSQVNHIDGNKKNYQLSNLEWVTPSENQIHSRYILQNKTGFTDTPVMCVETNKIYKSTRDAWRDTGVGYSHISECVNGKRQTAGGYHWRAAE